MPIRLATNAPSLLIRRQAFERAEITRATIDEQLGLTDEEFRVEGDLIVVGPVHDDGALRNVIEDLEAAGLVYFDDFFDLSGNWPGWLVLYVQGSDRSNLSGA